MKKEKQDKKHDFFFFPPTVTVIATVDKSIVKMLRRIVRSRSYTASAWFSVQFKLKPSMRKEEELPRLSPGPVSPQLTRFQECFGHKMCLVS